MSAPGLFVVGTLVTLVVAIAMALLIYAAILDGRDERRSRARGRARDGETANEAVGVNDPVPVHR